MQHTAAQLAAYDDDGSSESVQDERIFGDSSDGSQDDQFGTGGITNTDLLAKVHQKPFTDNEILVPNILGPPQLLPIGSYTLSPMESFSLNSSDEDF